MRLSNVGTLATDALVQVGRATNRTFVLPLLIFYPTGRCNSRCVSCDWWKHSGADDLSLAEILDLASSLPALGTRVVVFSGGEPLLRPEVFDAAEIFRARAMTLHLLTRGVLLERFVARVAEQFVRVIVSLDAEGFAARHPHLVSAPQRVEDRVAGWPGIRSWGDHFLIVLRQP